MNGVMFNPSVFQNNQAYNNNMMYLLMQNNLQNNLQNIVQNNIQNLSQNNLLNLLQALKPKEIFNNDWEKAFDSENIQDNNQNNIINNIQGPKMNLIFHHSTGNKTNIIVDLGTRVHEALKKYLEKVGRKDLINNLDNKFCFLYNGNMIKLTEEALVEDFFKDITNNTIVVNDQSNLIGAFIQ